MKKVAFHNLGCKVNSYEIEVMQQMLQEKGYIVVPFEQVADIYIVNTCTVTNIADRKSRQMLHQAKKRNSKAIVVAVGCYVQTGKDAVEMDECIDLAVGNNRKKDLAVILEEYLKLREEAGQAIGKNDDKEDVKNFAIEDKTLHDTTVIDINNTYEYEEMTLKQTAEHTRAYIKIQDGCNQFCSYCVIPYARGRVRSRRLEDILAEIEGIVAAGYREIVLTGIHISSYGIDFEDEAWQQGRSVEVHRGEVSQHVGAQSEETRGGESQSAGAQSEETRSTGPRNAASQNDRGLTPLDYSGESKLIDLVERIHEIPGLDRIRLGSLEPRIVTEEGAKRLAAMPKLCPHFHLSLQSGCDETLKRMNRRYTAGEYFRSVEFLRREFEEPAITTDVIVGFPGETEEEFAQTKAFLEKISFYEMHVFKYSKRAGTRAAVMPNQIPDQMKTIRSNELLALEKAQSKDFRSRYIGKSAEVLFEEVKEIKGTKYLLGHTRDYVKVAVPLKEEMSDRMPNQLVTVEIAEFLNDEILLGC